VQAYPVQLKYEGFGLASSPITELFNTSPTGDITAISCR